MGYINATLNTKRLYGSVAKAITVRSDDPLLPSVRLTVKAVIVGSVVLRPEESIRLSNRRQRGAVGQLLIRQEPTEKGVLEVSRVASSVPWLTARATRIEETRRAADGLPTGRPGDYLLQVEMTDQPPKRGRNRAEVRFETGLERQPVVTVPVDADWAPPVTLSTEELRLKPGDESATLLISVRRGLDPKKLTVQTVPDDLQTVLEPSGDRFFRLHVSWSGEPPSSGTITLALGEQSYEVPILAAAAP